MRWRPAGRQAWQSIYQLLETDEWKHVALSAKIRDTRDRTIFGRMADGRLWIREQNNGISGVLYTSGNGITTPAFEPEAQSTTERAALRKLLIMRRDRLFSIIGMENRVQYLENLLGEIPPDAENYRMFTLDEGLKNVTELPRGVTLHRAGEKDVDALWPLERAYQMEEVVRSGNRLEEGYGRRIFAAKLKHQEVYFALLKGRPVAKAGTNARGAIYDQIGGVFVSPEFRGQGMAKAVMTRLLGAIHTANRRACLFVKNSNTQALRLYNGMGFVNRGPFRISYWS